MCVSARVKLVLNELMNISCFEHLISMVDELDRHIKADHIRKRSQAQMVSFIFFY